MSAANGFDHGSYRAHLERELAAYSTALGGAIADPVLLGRGIEACPGWDVRELTHHLITIHHWVAHAIARTGDQEPARVADADLAAGFEASSALLLRVLDGDPGTACWTFAPDRTLGFWQRRQPHEHAIHRYDLEAALGAHPRLDAALAADGVDEVVTMFWPRQIRLGRVEAPVGQVRLTALDAGQSWLLGAIESSASPVAEVAGTAEALCLALWSRLGWAHTALSWTGDEASGRAVLNRALVP